MAIVGVPLPEGGVHEDLCKIDVVDVDAGKLDGPVALKSIDVLCKDCYISLAEQPGGAFDGAEVDWSIHDAVVEVNKQRLRNIIHEFRCSPDPEDAVLPPEACSSTRRRDLRTSDSQPASQAIGMQWQICCRLNTGFGHLWLGS